MSFLGQGMILPVSVLPEGVHPLGVRRQADRGHGGPQGAGVGPAQHGLRAAAPRVQPQVPDALHPGVSQQAGAPLPRPSFRDL